MANHHRRDVSVKSSPVSPITYKTTHSDAVDMLAVVSHELKTPLTIIKTALDNMNQNWESIEQRQTMLQMCNRAINRLITLLDGFLDLAKIESGQMAIKKESQPLFQSVQHIIHLFTSEAHAKGITLKNNVDEKLPLVMVDIPKLEQILTNLVHNAIKYTKKGGIVSVEARIKAHMMEVVVKDTGMGIPKEDQNLIFDKFKRARNSEKRFSGSGLGLYISKALVEAHGGTIALKSILHKGSTFLFTLPLSP